MATNINQNSALQAFQVPKQVYTAIQKAANATGVNFSYLMEKAAAESGFDANAKAKTSSATGLFQFIESTWLTMVKDHGDKYGLSKYADKIDDKGRVASRKDRAEILALRKDPEIASLMAAEFDIGNYNTLKSRGIDDVGSTELYMAHILGAGGASSFLTALKKSPNMTAADIFPREARANRNVFFDSRTGQPRSMAQVYAFFDKKFESQPVSENIAVANATPLRTQGYTGPRTQNPEAYAANTDPLARLTSLMDVLNAQDKQASLLRIAGSQSADNVEIFPPSLYGKLSLSPAQMMMLSDFTA